MAANDSRVGGVIDSFPRAGLRSQQSRIWGAAAALLVGLGTIGSLAAAQTLAHSDAAASRRAFVTSSTEIASSVTLALQHEVDLVVSAQTFFLGNPGSSESAFVAWMRDARAFARYPEVLGLGEAVMVPASQLGAFAARATAASSPPGARRGFQVIPPGHRAFYCFSVVGLSRSPAASPPPGTDFCAGRGGAASLASRDSGQASIAPITIGKTTSLGVETPIYRGGVVPRTVAARRAAFVGWVGMSLTPGVILATALDGHPGTTVSLRYGGTSAIVFRRGRAPEGARTVLINLHDGWALESSAAAGAGGTFSDGGPLTRFLGGVALSVLLAALLFVLGTSRARAVHLVRQRTDELRHQALHDALTGLPNRALIMDRIEQLLERGRRSGTSGAAMYIDIDSFKTINDSLGHAVGDQLLQALAARLTATLRGVDTIGRMGGDEFVVLLDGGLGTAGADLVAERILEAVRRPFAIGAVPLAITASIGIAAGDRTVAGELLRDADVALYEAKAAGKNRAATFHPEMQFAIRDHLQLELDLRFALREEQFRLVYQPIYDLGDHSVVGVEALLRWQHPTRGVIEPAAFLPLLETTGAIVEVGRFVLGEACAQVASWQRFGNRLELSVNVCGRQLEDERLVADVRDALERTGLEPGSLILELTETGLMRDVAGTARRLRELKALGVQMAIDDFNAGYSSIAYLENFPLDILKIDCAFTNEAGGSTESQAVLHTLVQLGKDLGLQTLAEGVERLEQADYLSAEHCDRAQGFLFARPLDPQTLEAGLLHGAEGTSDASMSAGVVSQGTV